MWTDPRYAAVPEARRTELWREFRAVLAELPETLDPSPSPVAPPAGAAAEEGAPAAAPDLAPGAPDLAPAPGLGSLTALQAEQARLQLEYAKMEACPSLMCHPNLNLLLKSSLPRTNIACAASTDVYCDAQMFALDTSKPNLRCNSHTGSHGHKDM